MLQSDYNSFYSDNRDYNIPRLLFNSELWKFGFIKRVDIGRITTVKDLESRPCGLALAPRQSEFF